MKQTTFTPLQKARMSTGRVRQYLALLDQRAAGIPDSQLRREYRLTKARFDFLLQDWVRPALNKLLERQPLEPPLIRTTDEPPTITTILTDSTLDRYFQ